MKLKGLLLIAMLLSACGTVRAQTTRQQSPDELAREATDKAVWALLEEVGRLPAGGGLTVLEFVDRLRAANDLMGVLRRAEQIGGPRWIDGRTCQVQLEIAGTTVARALKDIARAHGRRSPLNALDIDRGTSRWVRQTFIATGSVTSINPIQHAPLARLPGAWERIGESDRQAALATARDNAIRHIVESLAPVRLSSAATLGQALSRQPAQAQFAQWLSERPVSRIDFREDLQIEVALSIGQPELFAAVRDVLVRAGGTDLPASAQEWDRVWDDFAGRPLRPVGRASAPHTPTTAAALGATLRDPPPWVDGHLDAEGFAQGASSKLKAALAAESDARAKLRAKLLLLQWNGVTLAEAAKREPWLDRAISRAIERARLTKTYYLGPQSARVWLDLNLRDVWDEFRK